MEEIKNTARDFMALLDAGSTLADPTTSHGGEPFVVVPDNYKVHDLENLLPHPSRKRAKVTTTDVDSFIAYTRKHGSLDECTIYAAIDPEQGNFELTGIINDHGSDVNAAQWRDHRCMFEPKPSVEWKRWTGKNKSNMTQGEFAAWLEDNLGDIANVPGMPTGADILQMALGFEANADKKLRSKINLQDGGVRMEFVDDADEKTRTSMKVFERFTLGLPVFYGSASAYPLEARLKYREREGRVTFWYELIRPDRVFQTAVTDDLKRIQDATGFPVIYGTP